MANVLAYAYEVRLWTESLPSGQAWLDFIRTWGLVPAVFARGQYIGLFTSMFLHGDVVHLLGNMLMLWAFVGTLERRPGIGAVRAVVHSVGTRGGRGPCSHELGPRHSHDWSQWGDFWRYRRLRRDVWVAHQYTHISLVLRPSTD